MILCEADDINGPSRSCVGHLADGLGIGIKIVGTRGRGRGRERNHSRSFDRTANLRLGVLEHLGGRSLARGVARSGKKQRDPPRLHLARQGPVDVDALGLQALGANVLPRIFASDVGG